MKSYIVPCIAVTLVATCVFGLIVPFIDSDDALQWSLAIACAVSFVGGLALVIILDRCFGKSDWRLNMRAWCVCSAAIFILCGLIVLANMLSSIA